MQSVFGCILHPANPLRSISRHTTCVHFLEFNWCFFSSFEFVIELFKCWIGPKIVTFKNQYYTKYYNDADQCWSIYTLPTSCIFANCDEAGTHRFNWLITVSRSRNPYIVTKKHSWIGYRRTYKISHPQASWAFHYDERMMKWSLIWF